MKDQEFIVLAQLAMHDGELTDEEDTLLRRWAHKHGWKPEKTNQMLERAHTTYDSASTEHSNDDHLMMLIRLSLADGNLSQFEINTIRTVAGHLGYDTQTVRELVDRVRNEANPDSLHTPA